MSGDEGETKKLCLGETKKIGTHNGTFHCDEVLACFMLKQLPEYENASIVRTRDQSVLDTCDIVVDVGAVYDPAKHRYDHHQRTFSESMNSLDGDNKWVTKLSSAGLVYFHFGARIIARIIGKDVDSPLTKVIYDKIYEKFVEEIDAIDNGISQSDETPRYSITTNISARVGGLNPRWNEKGIDMEERFHSAMSLVSVEFMDRVTFYAEGWWPARELVIQALNKRKDVDESGEIMLLSEGGLPWKAHLLTVEEELEISGTVKFILFTDQSGKWRIQAVPLGLNSFDLRVSILKDWCGLRNQELSEKSGIPGCVFVHMNGFIGGNETYEGVLEMARRTLQAEKENSTS